MWSILEKVGKYKWEKKSYLWVRIDIVRKQDIIKD